MGVKDSAPSKTHPIFGNVVCCFPKVNNFNYEANGAQTMGSDAWTLYYITHLIQRITVKFIVAYLIRLFTCKPPTSSTTTAPAGLTHPPSSPLYWPCTPCPLHNAVENFYCSLNWTQKKLAMLLNFILCVL